MVKLYKKANQEAFQEDIRKTSETLASVKEFLPVPLLVISTARSASTRYSLATFKASVALVSTRLLVDCA